MGDIVVAGILLVLSGTAIFYIWKEKKRGTKCIGCPSAGCCTSKCSSGKKDSNYEK